MKANARIVLDELILELDPGLNEAEFAGYGRVTARELAKELLATHQELVLVRRSQLPSTLRIRQLRARVHGTGAERPSSAQLARSLRDAIAQTWSTDE